MKYLFFCFLTIALAMPAWSAPRYVLFLNDSNIDDIGDFNPESSGTDENPGPRLEWLEEPLKFDWPEIMSNFNFITSAWLIDTTNGDVKFCIPDHLSLQFDGMRWSPDAWWPDSDQEPVKINCVFRIDVRHHWGPFAFKPLEKPVPDPVFVHDPESDIWVFDGRTGLTNFCVADYSANWPIPSPVPGIIEGDDNCIVRLEILP